MFHVIVSLLFTVSSVSSWLPDFPDMTVVFPLSILGSLCMREEHALDEMLGTSTQAAALWAALSVLADVKYSLSPHIALRQSTEQMARQTEMTWAPPQSSPFTAQRSKVMCHNNSGVYSHQASVNTLNALHAKSAETLCLSSSGVEVCVEFLTIHALACHLSLATLRSCTERNPRLQTVHSTKPSPSHLKVCKCLRLGTIANC